MATSASPSTATTTLSWSTIAATLAAMLGTWIAAGSTGVLAEPLRVSLTLLVLFFTIAMVRPRWDWVTVLCVLGLLILVRLASMVPMREVFCIAAILALLAAGRDRPTAYVFCVCAIGAVTLGIFRLTCLCVPAVWSISDTIGEMLGRSVTAITAKPLSVGATFAGMDLLLVMAVMYLGWLYGTDGPRAYRAMVGGAAILGGHFVYLFLLAHAVDVSAQLAEPPIRAVEHPYVPPPWHWTPALRKLLPWNLPLVGVLIQLIVAGVMLRWGVWRSQLTHPSSAAAGTWGSQFRWRPSSLAFGAAIVFMAGLFAVVSTWAPSDGDLSGRTIMANRHGRLDWRCPEFDSYGQQSAGTFGVLPRLVRSLGGEFSISSNLTREELAGSDVLLLLHPNETISREQLERIWDFVRGGGALLVVADSQGGFTSACNSVLEPTAISVRQDVAISATGDWRQACQTFTHRAISGFGHQNGHSVTDAGASLKLRSPARPVLVGRWGWSDPGRDAVQTGVYEFEVGERLGDLVLAAAQPFGEGTILVLGDSLSMTNEGMVRGYESVARLLTHLAAADRPSSMWRQSICLATAALLLFLLVWRVNCHRLVMACLTLITSLVVCASLNRDTQTVLPAGRPLATAESSNEKGGCGLAYIDTSHVEAFVDYDWSFDAVNGLALTLMRNGYLTLALPQVTAERLAGADVLVSIAPARRFSVGERKIVREFVQHGGVVICTVGAEEALASRPLLAEFGLDVPTSPVATTASKREPEPMGRFRASYLVVGGNRAREGQARVDFFSGWPVAADDVSVEVLVRGKGDQPIVLCRSIGRGKIVLIGDSGFAMNKNLEYVGGEPFEGRYDNAHFWRWLIAHVSDRPAWFPPQPARPDASRAPAGSAPATEAEP